MQTFRFTVYGEPVAKGRPKFVRATGRTYTPKKTVEYENLVRLSFIEKYKGEKLTGEIAATIIAYFSIPKSESKKTKEKMIAGTMLCAKKVDCDNVAKSVLDALNDIAYDDDKQICRLCVEKRYSDTPRVEVILGEIEH